jgi:predicted Zn-dependent peptidase
MVRRFLVLTLLLSSTVFVSAYDLSKIQSTKLENGLTVLVLEDHVQPLVSTQVLYKVGARNECVGTTGLAHFVEHMAFRATKNFPATEVASKIYAVGGEWHAYTWIDETTYFETVPVKYLDLVLQIQSDRMQNLLINADEVDAERGAVLTELHSYENDPSLVLSDQVLAMSFVEHPYRYNTIGWTSDVEKINHDDLVSFYHRFYHSSNAVLAIVGDVQSSEVIQKVRRYFGAIPDQHVDSLPRTIEPPQAGVRRVSIQGSAPLNYFQITYRAPAAGSSDYPAFLLLQAVLGGAPGLNLKQDLDGEVVHAGTRLAGIGQKVSTFFMPTANPYVFSIEGQADLSAKTEDIEADVEKRVAELRKAPVSEEELQNARKQLLTSLIFDIESPEDAAHQLAYFAGIDALSVLQNLPSVLKDIHPGDVQAVAQKYLQPDQRTIGWYFGKPDGSSSIPASSSRIAARRTGSPLPNSVEVKRLHNGVPVILRRVERSPSGFLRTLVDTNTVEAPGEATSDDPVWRYTSVHSRFLKGELLSAISDAGKVFRKKWEAKKSDVSSQEDPEFRLNQALEEIVGAKGAKSGQDARAPKIVSIVGDIDTSVAFDALQKELGNLPAARKPDFPPLKITDLERIIKLPGKAQSQYGYAVLAPAPAEHSSYAFRILLYVLTHGYEGRLGKELISQKGLIYYIGGDYKSDGKNAWIAISFGVNPDKLEETSNAFHRIFKELQTNPPTTEEIAEAKEYLIGRRLTANQSNAELSAFYAKEWIEQGRLLSDSEYEKTVRSITVEEVNRAIPAFLNGAHAVVDTR